MLIYISHCPRRQRKSAKQADRTLTDKQQCNPEDSKKKEIFREKRTKPSKRSLKEISQWSLRRFELEKENPHGSVVEIYVESLILAQDERWRRA